MLALFLMAISMASLIRVLKVTLGELEYVLIYVDDLVVFSEERRRLNGVGVHH